MHISPDSMLYYVVVLLIFGNLFALLVGVLMLAAPQRVGALFEFSNRWVSTRKISKPLGKPRSTERVVLQYPRLLGAILLASAALILVKGMIFITRMSAVDGGRLLEGLYGSGYFSSHVWEMLWVALVAFVTLGAVMAVGVGLMSLFQLGRLKRWAAGVNRWVSTRQMTKPLDTPHYPLEKLVVARPRLWGGVITVLALFSALVLWLFVLGR